MPSGRLYNFKTADDLRNTADEYFKWCDDNPIRGQRSVRSKDGNAKDPKGKIKGTSDEMFPRPYTFEGFCRFAGISDYSMFCRNNKDREGFAEVLAYIRNRIRCNQIEGGLVGIYQPNLVARLNGIAENLNTAEKPAINLLATEVE